MQPTLREMPCKPCVDRAEGEFAALRPGTRAWNVVEQPRDLRPAEVGVEHEAGLVLDDVLDAGLAQLRAFGGRAPVLPDDRVMERLAALPVPEDRGFALIGNAGSDNFRRANLAAFKRLAGYIALRLENLH